MDKIILKYLVKNIFGTILIIDLFATISLFIYQTYRKDLEINNHEIGVSSYIIHGILTVILFFYFFLATLPIYLNLIEKVRNVPLFCFLSFFLAPLILFILVLYFKKNSLMIILICLGWFLIYINFYYRFKKFLISLKTKNH
jgi:phosphotransferase system  glucose/maltose/N-acetylglucosamine-specific IIC component